MITGFNTDIEHDGVVYHVQTEDKGLASPLILSLVYSGGAILASKRSPYNDLISDGFDEEKLSQRLKQQHRLICAAISAGRIEELKGMGSAGKEGKQKPPSPVLPPPPPARPEAPQPSQPPQPLPPVVPAVKEEPVIEPFILEDSSVRPGMEDLRPYAPPSPPPTIEELRPPPSQPRFKPESAYTVYDNRRKAPKRATKEVEDGLVLTILDETDFYAGRPFAIRILLQQRSAKKEKPVGGVTLSLKILGTTFRPKIFSVKTGRDGVGEVSGEIPHFDSGRAAIVIRADIDERSAEVRRVIHPAA